MADEQSRIDDHPLTVEIRYGEQVRVVELADPRDGFCREFNEQWKEIGATARPI